MKKRSFEEIIKHIEVPYNKNHKIELKQNLLKKAQQLYNKKYGTDEPKENTAPWYSLFLKKSFALFTLLVFICTIVLVRNQLIRTDVAKAQAIVDQAIKNLSDLNFDQKNMSPDLRITIDILQKALDENNLRYVGEDDLGDRKSYKLAFNDNDIGSGVLIILNPQNGTNYSQNALTPYTENYSRHAVQLEFANSLFDSWQGITTNIHIKTNKIDPDKLTDMLQDPDLKNELLKALIHKQNANFIAEQEQYLQKNGQWCDEGMGGNPNPPATSPSHLSDYDLANLIKNSIQNSDVLISSIICGRDQKGKIVSFNLAFQAMSKLKKNHDEAMDLLHQADQILTSYNTPEATIKKKLIQKMKTSVVLAHVQGNLYGKPQKDSKGIIQMNPIALPVVSASDCIGTSLSSAGTECPEIMAFIDLSKKNEKIVEFEYELSRGGENTKFTTITGHFKDGKISNLNDLLKNLQINKSQESALKNLVQYHNSHLLQNLTFHDLALNSKNAVITKLADQLEPIIQQSDMLLWAIDWNRDPNGQETEKNVETFTITAVPIENLLFSSENTDKEKQKAHDLIQETIKTLYPAPAKLTEKINLLKKARQANDLKYLGEETLTNGKKIKKLSFTDSASGQNTFLLIDPTDNSENSVIALPFATNEKDVYFYDKKIDGADGNSMQPLSYAYFRDKNNVYFLNEKIEGVDSNSFQVLDEIFAKDKNTVYANGKKIDGVDMATFTIIEEKNKNKPASYGKDKNAIYNSSGEKLQAIDPNTFQIVQGLYIKDKNGVYEDGRKLKGIDPFSFEILDQYYARDKDNVYSTFDGFQKLNEADPKSFEVLSFGYARDRFAVYSRNYQLEAENPEKIPGADSKSFHVLVDGHGKDKNTLYAGKQKVTTLDYASFQALNLMYSKDKNAVYYGGQKVEGVDPSSFQTFSPTDFIDYAKDKNHVYWAGKIIHEADPATFQPLYAGNSSQPMTSSYRPSIETGDGYGKDKNGIYYFLDKLNNIDADSFESLGNLYSKDKNGVYRENHKIPSADPKTFISLGNSYAKDIYHVYYVEGTIDKADPTTFHIFPDSVYAQDKNKIYFNGSILEN